MSPGMDGWGHRPAGGPVTYWRRVGINLLKTRLLLQLPPRLRDSSQYSGSSEKLSPLASSVHREWQTQQFSWGPNLVSTSDS